jgi:Bacteriophage related domain of unknown function
MLNETEIIAALQQAVTAAVADSNAPTLPVKYLMVGDGAGGAFVPPDDMKWLELVWLPNNRNGDFLGDEKNHRGILRLVLHWPVDGGGIYTPAATLASICAFFWNGQLLNGVQIYGTPDPTGIIEQGSEVLLPVSILYQSYRVQTTSAETIGGSNLQVIAPVTGDTSDGLNMTGGRIHVDIDELPTAPGA